MLREADRRLAEYLARIVRDLRELQERGRLQDPASRAEIEFLERELELAQARAARDPASEPKPQEAAGVSEAPSVGRPDREGGRLRNQES